MKPKAKYPSDFWTMRVEFYSDKRGKHRWRLRARNNRIVAESGQGYGRRHDAKHAFWTTIVDCNDALVTRDLP